MGCSVHDAVLKYWGSRERRQKVAPCQLLRVMTGLMPASEGIVWPLSGMRACEREGVYSCVMSYVCCVYVLCGCEYAWSQCCITYK